MKLRYRLAYSIIAVFLFCESSAYSDTFEIKGSTSPNGAYYLSFDTQPYPDNPHFGDADVQIRSRKTKEILKTFPWNTTFCPYPDTSCPIIWKPDSQAVIITGYVERGWTQSYLYVLSKGKWQEVDIPVPVTKFSSKDGWETTGKAGSYTATRWKDRDILIMDYSNPTYRISGNGNDREWGHSHYAVYLHLSIPTQGASTLTQVKVEELPEPKN